MGCIQFTFSHSKDRYDLPSQIHYCSLKQYNHCCRDHCLAYKESQKAVLYALECNLSSNLIEIIMNYLPDDPHRHVQCSTPGQCPMYYKVMNTSDTLCPIWFTHCMNTTNQAIQMVMLGDGRVGKTSLVKRFIEGVYTEAFHDPSIDEYVKHITMNGEPCTLRITDFAAQDQAMSVFRLINDDIMRSGQIFLCCFSADSPLSFQHVLDTRKRILQCKEGEDDWAMILVATKCDLMDSSIRSNQITFVDTQQAMERAKQWNIGYIETSAKNNINVDALFQRSVYEYWIQSESHQHGNGS
eukprot:1166517_1